MSLHNQTGPDTPSGAEDLLDLIIRHLPDLWQAQHRSRSRSLRAVLNAAERIARQRQPRARPGPNSAAERERGAD